ncbi:MAG: hypothetical protein GPJ52_01170 [Candidatus Heimdallarchaeota archaeon]|nr:hypothetical protein [Candidatus Heimdallarchaeota archaeon]MCG3253947.1 hypothetical protein [Candidatus Heimdallarchaeota archaeon]MCK4291079.1 hypothetical protein [Candidatus Heimdallarchaeota archaeon]
MSANEEKSKATSIFESRFMSIALMLCLLIMCAIFIVVINSIFGITIALNVLMYIGIGVGGGILFVVIILLIFSNRKAGISRNIILYSAALILILSLIISLILNFAFSGEQGSWAFINTSSIGLGMTTGLALTYLMLAMFRSKLVFREEKEDETKTDIEIEIGEKTEEMNEKE